MSCKTGLLLRGLLSKMKLVFRFEDLVGPIDSPFGKVVLNGGADSGAKSTRKPNFGTFGPIIIIIIIIIYILSRNMKP